MLESAKRMARLSAYYFTQPSSYCPVPSSQIDWKDFPRMEPLKSPLMSPEDKKLMRKWARDHVKCVRQRTDTTKYKAGTLPLNMYQTSGTLQSLGEGIVWPSEHDEDQNVNVQEKPAEVDMDQASEYDTESDEEPEEDENVSAQEPSEEVGGKNRELNFLFMAPRTRSGRIIRTSFRVLLWQ